MRTEPKTSFNSNVSILSGFNHIVNWLKFSSLVFPNEIDFLLGKLVFSQQSNNPSEHLAFIRIIKVVVIIVGICIVVYSCIHIPNICHCPNFACCFIQEHFSCIFYHQFPENIIEPFPQLGQNIWIFFFPDLAESQCTPEHLSIVQGRNSINEIMSGRWDFTLYLDPWQETSISRIFRIESLKGISLLFNNPEDFIGSIYFFSELGPLENFGHDSQVDTLFAAGCKLMKTFGKKLPCCDINSNSIKGQSCYFIDSDLVNEVSLPSGVCSQEIVTNGWTDYQIRSRIIMCEPAIINPIHDGHGSCSHDHQEHQQIFKHVYNML